LNGDGVADIVAWTRTSGNPRQPLELKAFSGIDGTPLWHDVPPIRGQPLLDTWFNLPTVADVEGKGDHVILVVRQRQLDSPEAEFRATQRVQTPVELVAVSGRDGRVKWTWPWLNAVGDSLPPLAVDFDGSGRRLVCQVIQEWSSDTLLGHVQLALVDGAGKLRRKIPLSPRRPGYDGTLEVVARWLRKVDLNGDGKEALLVCTDDKLKMLGADLEAKWTWPVPINEQIHVPEKADLVDILPAEGGKSATVVVWAGKSVYGLSAATGRPRWRGEMLDLPPPNSRNDRPDPHPERVLLRDRTGLGLPRLLADESCRLTWPVDEQGRYHPPRGEPVSYATLEEPAPVATRSLPWAPGHDGFSDIVLLVQMIPWTLVWLVVPVLLIRWAMKRNSWRLAFVPAFYQLAMTLSLKVIPMSWLPFNTSESQNWDPHIGMCFLSGVYLIVHGAWMMRRRRLWVLVDASAVYAIAIALGWAQRGPQVANSADLGAVLHIEVPASVMYFYLPSAVLFSAVIVAARMAQTWLRRGERIRFGIPL
ncbi:MAG TPA: hypothetical protein VGX76_11130, partial [Pirellulales bacterium]|nr:hypothetical protein [Pirellulales bacterium]